MEPFSVELEQNDLYMDFEDFMEDDEAEGGDEGEESTVTKMMMNISLEFYIIYLEINL